MLSIKRLFKRGYSQNSALLITCGALLAMLFFRFDTLLGAIGLRAFYTVLGIVLFAILPLILLILFISWGKRTGSLIILLGILFIAGVLIVNQYLILLGWFTGIAARMLPTPVLLIGFLVALAIWIWQVVRPINFHPEVVKQLTAGVLLVASAYTIGMGSLPENAERSSHGSIQFANNHYFLVLYWGWLGDLDTLVLYRCNQFALFCVQVHTTDGSYWNKQISLIPDTNTNVLNIQVDGAAIFTYRP